VALSQRALAFERDRAPPAEGDMVMLEAAALVLAGLNLRAQAVRVGREVKGVGRRLGLRRSVKQPSADLDLDLGGSATNDRQRNLRACRAGVDLRDRIVETATRPAPEILALHPNLRRIDDGFVPDIGDAPLAFREARLGKPILPSNVIPVIDVQRDRNHAPRNVSAHADGGKPAIGGRTAATAFRSEQFDQHIGPVGRARAAHGSRRRRGARKTD